MSTLSGRCTVVRRSVRAALRPERLCFAAGCLSAFWALLFVSCLVGAQETRQGDDSREMTLDLSEKGTLDKELPAGKRLMLEIPLPSVEEREKGPEVKEPSGSAPPATASESEFWQVVGRVQQDLEMLKEEIAQLRSEFRSLIPKDAEDDSVTKRTVNPFWITDAQLGRLEQR